MDIVAKCSSLLPKWDDVSRNLPFIAVTGAVALSFFMISKQNDGKSSQSSKKKKGHSSQKVEQTGANPVSGVIGTTPTTNPPSTTSTTTTTTGAITANSIQESINAEQKIESLATQQSEIPDQSQFIAGAKSQALQNNFKSTRNAAIDSEKSKSSGSRKLMRRAMQGSNLPALSSKRSQKSAAIHINGVSGGTNAHEGNNSSSSSANNTRVKRGSDDEEVDEQEDIMDISQAQSKGSNGVASGTTVNREKVVKKARAPIIKRFNKNFATDTENNEKLQKLKSIAQKEKKAEDKMFFQMLMNIVGTEADDDDDQ